ncbi:MAG: tRNA pseudouridine(55) synthase TruB, partial [Desulfobacula sp.]|nr:tRNA pseudouridine(55) synthase TruB [Desulfobacula sp.]
CRTQSSAFTLENAIDLEAFERLNKTMAEQRIVPLADCLDFMPKILVDESIAKKIQYGQRLTIDEMGRFQADPDQSIRVVDENNFLLAIIQFDENSREFNYSCVFPS